MLLSRDSETLQHSACAPTMARTPSQCFINSTQLRLYAYSRVCLCHCLVMNLLAVYLSTCFFVYSIDYPYELFGLQVRELRAKSAAAAAATAKAQQQAETANSELVKLQTQASHTQTLEAELAELKLQLRSAQTLAAQQQQEAMLSRGVSWGPDGGDTGPDSNGASPRLLSPRPSFSVRQGAAGSRRGSGGSPLNPRLSSTGMQVLPWSISPCSAQHLVFGINC